MKKQYTNYYKLLIAAIDSEEIELLTDSDKIKFCHARFLNEFGFVIKRYGFFKALTEWLQGLAIDIPFMNYDILELAKANGQVLDNEAKEQDILNKYWGFMAMRLQELFKNEKLSIN